MSEYTVFDDVCALAEFIEEHGSLSAKLYEHLGKDIQEAQAAFGEYAGEFKSAADFAEDLTCETGPDIPTALKHYIDWASLARAARFIARHIQVPPGARNCEMCGPER